MEHSDDDRVPTGSEEEEDASGSDAPDSNGEGDDEVSTGESDAEDEAVSDDDSSEEDEWDARTDNMREVVTQIIQRDPCSGKCLRGKAADIERVLTSVGAMTSRERKQNIYSALAVLMYAEAAAPKRSRSGGERRRFQYHLPYLGSVCQGAFALCMRTSKATIARYRKEIEGGSFAIKRHGNNDNTSARKIDFSWIETWFEYVTETIGELVPVTVRRRKKANGVTTRYSSELAVTMIPAHYTWERLYAELETYAKNEGCEQPLPAYSTFRAKLKKRYPHVRIRSPRSNVCDVCFVYKSEILTDASADTAERFGQHTAEARAMREEYKQDQERASKRHWVVTMDYAQNYNVPSVPDTPSQWYFLSLLNVSVFGVHVAHAKTQFNFIYSEGKGGKGPNEVISMLQRVVEANDEPEEDRTLTVYADNCSGQNKNNYVLKYCLALAHSGLFREVTLKFLVKGHTKNACDRGFGVLKRHVMKQECWTLAHLHAAMNNASDSLSAILLDGVEGPAFNDYKVPVTELYKNLRGIKKYQIFRMRYSRPGIVECRVRPSDTQVEFDLRKRYSGVIVEEYNVKRLLASANLEPIPDPEKKIEKLYDTYNQIRKYVPKEFVNDSLYAKPSEAETKRAKDIKRARRELRESANAHTASEDAIEDA